MLCQSLSKIHGLSRSSKLAEARDWLKLEQCDELKPACSACERLGNECEYPEQTFHDQSVLAKTHAIKKWRARVGERELKTPESSRSALARRPPTLGPSLGAPRKQMVLGRFLVDFAASDRSKSDVLFPMSLPDATSSAATDSSLSLAIFAAAEMNFATRFHVPSLKLEATQKYAKVLQHLQWAVSNTRRSRSDEVLATIMVCGLYEVGLCLSILRLGIADLKLEPCVQQRCR